MRRWIRWRATSIIGTLGVNVAVFRAGKILLTKREDFHVWCMPGGHVDPGETFPESAQLESCAGRIAPTDDAASYLG